MPLLQAKNISHRFDYPLFENINLEVGKKESVAIVGVSGSGKSTLLHILSTLLPPQHGDVILLGHPIYRIKDEERLRLRRMDVGIVFQSHYLFKGFTAKENIEVAALLAKSRIDEDIVKAFGIGHVLEKKVGELSGGEQQRVSVARVMTKKPKMIFADEPTGNLDEKTAKDVMDKIFEYLHRNDAGLFLVTHDRGLAKRCDRVFELKNRRLYEI